MSNYTSLEGIPLADRVLLRDAMKENLIAFFNWALLEAQAFVNVPVLMPGIRDQYGLEALMPVHDEGIPDGKVWEAAKSNWVWESGFGFADPPIQAFGVYVNGVSYPSATTTGTYQHTINFPQGRVVFVSPIPTTAIVQASYSYRWCNFYDNDEPWFESVMFDTFLADPNSRNQGRPDLGLIALLNQHRAQLPMVIVEPAMTRTMRGLELGSTAKIVRQDMLFHILAENGKDLSNIADTITLNQDKRIFLYDVNARNADGESALNWDCSIRPGAKMYPQLVDMPPSGYRWLQCRFQGMTGQDVSRVLPLHRGIVRGTFEVDFAGMP